MLTAFEMPAAVQWTRHVNDVDVNEDKGLAVQCLCCSTFKWIVKPDSNQTSVCHTKIAARNDFLKSSTSGNDHFGSQDIIDGR